MKMLLPSAKSLLFVPLAASLGVGISHAQLTNYWPVNENSGSTTLNTGGGANGALFNGATFVTDAQRGQVLQLPGAGSYVNAGSIPALGVNSNFTWSFWANTTQGATSSVIVGNRYNSSGGEFVPREFVKFTNTAFEWHVNNGGQNVDYPDLAAGAWNHMALVKQGNLLISYRNGLVNGSRNITTGLNNAQPLYFGGDQGNESWTGKLDDIATWGSALPSSAVVGLAKGTYTPSSAPLANAALSTITSEDFTSGLGNWTPTNRGLEANVAAGYNAPSAAGGQLTLSGTTTSQYWYGTSVESVASYDATKTTEVSVDRVSISGTGSAFRSSLWILGDDTHYMHFSQNVNEGGWTWNSRDDGGQGTLNQTGIGNNIANLDALDTNLGLHNMKIRLEPTGDPGDLNMYLYLNGTLVAAQGFSNFPGNFKVVLTGQGRAVGDSVNAVFDNLLVQVPEPGSALLLLGSLGMLAARRRR